MSLAGPLQLKTREKAALTRLKGAKVPPTPKADGSTGKEGDMGARQGVLVRVKVRGRCLVWGNGCRGVEHTPALPCGGQRV